MSATADSVRERIARQDAFRRDEIAAYMEVETDLDLWSAVYVALDKSYHQIQSELDMEMACSFMLRYLLRCIRENPPSADIHSGFEAAWELAGCLKLWSERLPQTNAVLRFAEREIRREFLAGDEALRNRLETGTLEHALEASAVRPYFADWENNPTLRESWEPAMDWAREHGDPITR
jgi:hypothetical protein